MTKSGNAVVVGGGIAGLATAIYLARAGFTVTLFEKRRHLGGRAVTHLRHGYRFNLGPHALYQRGSGAAVLRELGIPIRGGVPANSGFALFGGERFRLPASPLAMLTTGLFGARQKFEAGKLMLRIRRGRQQVDDPSMTARQWLDANTTDALVRQFIEATMRLTSYCNDVDSMSAAAALAQVRLGMRGVIYLDEGWQKMVDALHSTAVTSGVNFVTSSRVVSIDHDERVRGVVIGGLDEHDFHADESVALRPQSRGAERGARIPADAVVMAIDPITARGMLRSAPWSEGYAPVVAGCLDVALSNLPQPKNLLAVGIDQPYYYSVHSRWAQLTPKGGALIHLMRYGGGDEQELETLLDELQPGWRGVLVYKRFMPSLIVSNAIPGVVPRPSSKTAIAGLYLAGDWVGDEGMLSDAALASARAAATSCVRECRPPTTAA
jgi:phytoene dehydrogenase-like protein